MTLTHRCTGTNRHGEPCGRPPIKGGTVCAAHGGSAPQVRDAARRRLLEAVDPVAARLVHLALNAESESVQLQAAKDLLDRAGLAAKQLIESEVTVRGPETEFDRRIRQLAEELATRDAEHPVGTPEVRGGTSDTD